MKGKMFSLGFTEDFLLSGEEHVSKVKSRASSSFLFYQRSESIKSRNMKQK